MQYTQEEEQIIEEARAWIGTKWMHGVSVKGYRTDCIQFIISVFKKIGWVPDEYKPIKYTHDWALHSSHSVLIDEISKFCRQLDNNDYKVGDIILFNYGRCASHVAIYVGDNKIIHAHIQDGVIESRANEFPTKFHSAWRFKDR